MLHVSDDASIAARISMLAGPGKLTAHIAAVTRIRCLSEYRYHATNQRRVLWAWDQSEKSIVTMWPITAKYCDHVTNHSWVLWSCEQWEMSIVTMRPNREKYCDHVTNERWVLPMLAAHIAIIWTWSLSELLAVRTSSYTHTRWGLVTTLTLLDITLSTLRDLWMLDSDHFQCSIKWNVFGSCLSSSGYLE